MIRNVSTPLAAALGIAMVALAPSAWAQAQRDWLTIDLGGIVNRFDSSVRVDGQRSGTDIDLEGNGLERNLSSFEAAITWRLAPRHRIAVQYYEAKRDGRRDYHDEITIGDETFPVGASVSAQARSRIANFDYRYSFVQERDHEVAVLVGFYGGRFNYELDAVGTAGAIQRSAHRTVSTTIPLPMLGITYDWYPDPRWTVSARLQGMKAAVGDIDGTALLAAASVEYMFTRHWGMGARLAYSDVEADVTKGDFNGNLHWRANSVSLYAKLAF
jgi:hypothetical protein